MKANEVSHNGDEMTSSLVRENLCTLRPNRPECGAGTYLFLCGLRRAHRIVKQAVTRIVEIRECSHRLKQMTAQQPKQMPDLSLYESLFGWRCIGWFMLNDQKLPEVTNVVRCHHQARKRQG